MKHALNLLLLLTLLGCSGSGAVNPLTPKRSTASGDSNSSTVAETVYWAAAPVTGTISETLNDIDLVNDRMGWICGNKTTILMWDGKTWSKTATGLTIQQDLYGISFANENEGWVVGERGLLLHYNQGKWAQETVPTSETLYDVAILSGRTGWAVGENGTLLQYDGATWTKVELPKVTLPLYAVSASDSGNAWVVGDRGVFLKYDGKAWTEVEASPTSDKLRAVDVDSDTEAWAAGAYGSLLRLGGSSWTKMNSPATGGELYDLQVQNGEWGWACGQDGTLLYYDGSRWIQQKPATGKPALNAVDFSGDKLGFVVGQTGTILKFQPGGELSKGTLFLEGTAQRRIGPAGPEWLLKYDLSNSGAQAVPLVSFHMTMPKGYKAVPVPALPTPLPTGFVPPTPTRVASKTGKPNPTPTLAAPWQVKKNLDWDLGNVAGSSSKSLTLILRSDPGLKQKGKIFLQASLKSKDETVAEAAAMTLGEDGKVSVAKKDKADSAKAANPSEPSRETGAPSPEATPPPSGPVPPKQ